jgi:hypothetical protein
MRRLKAQETWGSSAGQIHGSLAGLQSTILAAVDGNESAAHTTASMHLLLKMLLMLMLTVTSRCNHGQRWQLQENEMIKIGGKRKREEQGGEGVPLGEAIVFSRNRRPLLMRDMKSVSRQLLSRGGGGGGGGGRGQGGGEQA